MPSNSAPREPGHEELRQRWEQLRGTSTLAEVEVLVAVLALTDTTASTRRRLDDLAVRFAKRLHATGTASFTDVTEDDCDSFLWTPTRRNKAPSLHTVHLRRTALRVLYRALAEFEPDANDPTRTLDLPAKPSQRARALTDGELALVRTAALGRVRLPLRAAALIALAETTATTGELHQLRWKHTDLDRGTIALPGATPIDPRTGHLTDWGTGILRRWNDTTPHPPDTPIVGPRTKGTTRYAAQAAMTSALGRLIASAGLSEPDIRPGSIRLWAGATTLRDHGIEAAARALGLDSLDAAADALGHDWKSEP